MATPLTLKQTAAVMMHKAAISIIEASSYLSVAEVALQDIVAEDDGPDPNLSMDAKTAIGVLRILDDYEPILRTSTIAMVDVVFGVPFSEAFFESAVQQVKDDLDDDLTEIFTELAYAPSCLPVFAEGTFEIPMDD
jgi:hypothetical protein